MFVESMENRLRQSTSHREEIAGTARSSCAGVRSGLSPSGVISEAIVPPVPIIRMRFISSSSQGQASIPHDNDYMTAKN